MRTLHTFVLALLLVTAGCLGGLSPGTSTPEGTPTGSPTATPSSTSTPTPLDSLPSTDACWTGALTVPNATDGVEPTPYPEPPAHANRSAVVGYVMSFEVAYIENRVLAMESDDGMNLTRVTGSVEVRNVTRTGTGYRVETSGLGVPHYESDATGDYGYAATYVVNESALVRMDDGRETVVLRC